MNLTIGKLAAAGGVGVETVRYYQRRNLLSVPARSGGDGWGAGVRRYDGDDVRRLKFIRSAQAAGFTLDEIAELLALEASDDRVRVRHLARERIEALDTKIAQMTETRAALARLADLCAASDKGPCPILAAFEPPGFDKPVPERGS
ncbi:MerR family DNA-binding protein [Sphingopyxis sp. CCNWLW253]|uniref:MerR family transcriptional regulator n=1 Tax=unclassified Sphingopyxis TaxID=2614943 RepID=UPI003012E03F